MELAGFEPDKFSSCGIDAKAVQGVQILKYMDILSTDASTKMRIEDVQSCSNTVQPEQQEEEGLTNENVVEIIKKSVLVTGFLLGFQVMETEATDLLAERTLNHLEKMCKQLCILADRRRRGRPCSFINPMHQVLDMNNLSIPILHSFYCTRFLNLCNNPLKRFHKIKGNVETTQNPCPNNKLNNRKRKASSASIGE